MFKTISKFSRFWFHGESIIICEIRRKTASFLSRSIHGFRMSSYRQGLSFVVNPSPDSRLWVRKSFVFSSQKTKIKNPKIYRILRIQKPFRQQKRSRPLKVISMQNSTITWLPLKLNQKLEIWVTIFLIGL